MNTKQRCGPASMYLQVTTEERQWVERAVAYTGQLYITTPFIPDKLKWSASNLVALFSCVFQLALTFHPRGSGPSTHNNIGRVRFTRAASWQRSGATSPLGWRWGRSGRRQPFELTRPCSRHTQIERTLWIRTWSELNP